MKWWLALLVWPIVGEIYFILAILRDYRNRVSYTVWDLVSGIWMYFWYGPMLPLIEMLARLEEKLNKRRLW